MISANSFCIRLAEVLRAFDILGFGLDSRASLTGAGVGAGAAGVGVGAVAATGGVGDGVVPLLLWPAASCCWTLLLDGPAPVDMKKIKSLEKGEEQEERKYIKYKCGLGANTHTTIEKHKKKLLPKDFYTMAF